MFHFVVVRTKGRTTEILNHFQDKDRQKAKKDAFEKAQTYRAAVTDNETEYYVEETVDPSPSPKHA